MTEEKEKITNAFNNAWNKKIASENSYGKLASKEMFENKEEIKTEVSTDCSYYKDVMTEEIIPTNGTSAEDVAYAKKVKEIYIDGVNVAGCKYFNRFRNICHNKKLCCDCEKNNNCYYKQLKRLEQENKELKSDLKQYDVWLREERQDNAELATDNFKLRTALEEIRNLCNKGAGVYTNAKVVGLINEVLGND